MATEIVKKTSAKILESEPRLPAGTTPTCRRSIPHSGQIMPGRSCTQYPQPAQAGAEGSTSFSIE
jgi:hypothetical protein